MIGKSEPKITLKSAAVFWIVRGCKDIPGKSYLNFMITMELFIGLILV
jgi:hypothetical protein